MGRKNIISAELKLRAVKEYINCEGSQNTIAQKYGVSRSAFNRWIMKYKTIGKSAFNKTCHNNSYTEEFKIKVVRAYLSGENSFADIAIKFKIPSDETVRGWFMKYNSHEKLKSSGTGGVSIMTKGRKTNFDERIEIVKHCIEHEFNYAEAAQKFQVSYQQVYSWTNKYLNDGVDALQDRRGKRKAEDEMSEIEKLTAQNKLLEAENRRKQMEIDFLKKLEEIERRRS